jgi:hypothetical protein
MTCLNCEEPVLPGEQDPHFHSQPMHKECGIRGVVGSVGHLQKKCSCYGGTEEDPPGMTKRQAAQAAAALFRELNPPTSDAAWVAAMAAREDEFGGFPGSLNRRPPGFPARQFIDDQCDACGAKGLMGVSWGHKKPVLCEKCLRFAVTLLQPSS